MSWLRDLHVQCTKEKRDSIPRCEAYGREGCIENNGIACQTKTCVLHKPIQIKQVEGVRLIK